MGMHTWSNRHGGLGMITSVSVLCAGHCICLFEPLYHSQMIDKRKYRNGMPPSCCSRICVDIQPGLHAQTWIDLDSISHILNANWFHPKFSWSSSPSFGSRQQMTSTGRTFMTRKLQLNLIWSLVGVRATLAFICCFHVSTSCSSYCNLTMYVAVNQMPPYLWGYEADYTYLLFVFIVIYPSICHPLQIHVW